MEALTPGSIWRGRAVLNDQRQTEQVEQTSRESVAGNRTILDAAIDTMITTDEHSTNQSGYRITATDVRSELFRSAVATIEGDLGRLASLSVKNPKQQEWARMH
jgi:hypothetical protein